MESPSFKLSNMVSNYGRGIYNIYLLCYLPTHSLWFHFVHENVHVCFVLKLFQGLEQEIGKYCNQVRSAEKKLQQKDLETQEQVGIVLFPSISQIKFFS